MPTVSVIVPVYNVINRISRCIDSLIAQTYMDFELLLIDDGSTDGSGALCDEYAKKDNRIKVMHKENGGVSSARNLGISIAKGEYIAFCDSDDFVSEKYLETLLSNKADLVICGCYICSGDGNNAKVNRQECDGAFSVNEENILKWFENGSMYSVWTCLFKTRLVRENGILFDTNTSRGEDTIFIFEYISVCNTVFFTSAVMYYYVRYDEGGTLTTSYGLRNIYSLGYLDDYLRSWFKNKGLRSTYFENNYFWTRNELKNQFDLIFADKEMPLQEKKIYYKALKQQKGFYNNRKNLFSNTCKKFKFLVNTFYPHFLLLYDRIKNKKYRKEQSK